MMRTHMTSARALAVALAVALAAACAPPGRPATPAPAPAAMPTAVRWVAQSAEYEALTRQTYAAAARRLDQLAPAIPAGHWGVILDADETVLNNIEYARRRLGTDSAYTEASWSEWVREQAAPAIPGARGFTHHVHLLGGRVVIVTNRADSLCGPTRANLRAVGIEADLVLCMPPGHEDKNPRFASVEDGTASRDLPPLTVLEWLGDNIRDFPHLTQSVRGDPDTYALFGRQYFALPNPVYGSWQPSGGT
jgi:5'-nucleotidase (lipoprotein e(P4) family)